MNYVCVIWHDAHAAAHGWESIEELQDNEPYVVRSVGVLLAKDQGAKRGHVSIAQSFSADNHIDSVLHIPKKMVQKTIKLTETEVLTRQNINDIIDYLRRVTPRGYDDEQQLVAVIDMLRALPAQSMTGGLKSSVLKPHGLQPEVSHSR